MKKHIFTGTVLAAFLLTAAVLGIAVYFAYSVPNAMAEAKMTKAMQPSSRVNVKSPVFQYKKGLGAMKGGYYYDAIQHFQKAILVKPHYALAWAHMGVALHKLGFPSLAIVSLQRALKYNPNIKWAKITLKKYLSSSKR